MAKKKAATRRVAPKRAAKPRAKAAKPKTRRARQPRAQALPGMEQVRNARLDRLCESIGDARDSINNLRTEEGADQQAALREMHDKSIETYRHAGILLVRVPGEEKILVKKSRTEVATDSSTPAPEGGDLAGGAVDDLSGDE